MSSPYLDIECSGQITRLRPGGAYVLRVPKEWTTEQRAALEGRVSDSMLMVSWDVLPVVIVESDEVAILDLTERLRAQGALG